MQMVKVTEYVLFSVPLDMLADAGIHEESVIQMSASGGKILIEAVGSEDTENLLCDGDCDHCPFDDADCDGECENCPCYEKCDDAEGGCLS